MSGALATLLCGTAVNLVLGEAAVAQTTYVLQNQFYVPGLTLPGQAGDLLIADKVATNNAQTVILFPRQNPPPFPQISYQIAQNIRVDGDLGVAVARAFTGTLTGSLSGNGRFAKADVGIVRMDQAGTFTGLVVIADGVLRLTATNALGTPNEIAFLRDARIPNQTIPTLHINSGLTQSARLLTMNLGQLRLDGDAEFTLTGAGTTRSTESIIDGQWAGNGTVVKQGAFTLKINGNNNIFGGTTRIQGGAVELTSTGILKGLIQVENGGRLAATGGKATSHVQVLAGGMLAPGSAASDTSIGRLFANQLTMQAGSLYVATVAGNGTSDLVHVTGDIGPTATVLGGTLRLNRAEGGAPFRLGQTFTLLQTAKAASFGATRFAAFSHDFAFLIPELSYDTSDPALDKVKVRLGGNLEGGFAHVATTANQQGAATGAFALGLGHPVFDAVAVLSADEARRTFDQLSGEVNASAATVAAGDAALAGNALLDHLRPSLAPAPETQAALASSVQAYAADAPATQPVVAPVVVPPAFTVWGQAYGGRGSIDDDRNAASLNRSTGGLMMGVETAAPGPWRLGVAGFWSRSVADIDARLSKAEVDTFGIALYGAAQFGGLSLRGGLAYAQHEVDTSRTIQFPGYAGLTGASFGGHSLHAFMEAGYALRFGALNLEPYAGLAHTSTRFGSFVETGDAAALTGRASSMDVTSSTLGLRAAMSLGDVTLRGGVSWRHAFQDVTPRSSVAFAAGPAVPFTVAGAPLARNTLGVEAGLDWAVARNVVVGLSYHGQFARRAQDHIVKAELRVTF